MLLLALVLILPPPLPLPPGPPSPLLVPAPRQAPPRKVRPGRNQEDPGRPAARGALLRRHIRGVCLPAGGQQPGRGLGRVLLQVPHHLPLRLGHLAPQPGGELSLRPSTVQVALFSCPEQL